MALTTVPASLSATALTLTTAAQPNITSVGTLTGLTVSGNIAGTLTTAAQTNITSLGTLTGLTTSGNILINAASGNPYVSIKTAGTGNNPYVEYRAGNNTVFDTAAIFSGSTDRFRIGYGSSGSISTDLFTVTQDGKVGIGKVPAYASLEVEGDKTLANNLQLALNGATDTNKQMLIGFDTTLNKTFIINQIAGTAPVPLNIYASNVGISTGNFTPESGLHLYDGTNVRAPQNANRKATLIIEAGSEGSADIQLLNDSYSHIFFGDSADPNTGLIWYQHASGGTGADSLHFGTGGNAERVNIDSSGNVGIGTTNPASGTNTPLTLRSGSYVGLRLDGAGSAAIWDLYSSYSGGVSMFGIYDRANTRYNLVTTQNNNVGIGTETPASWSKLHISASSGGNPNTANQALYIQAPEQTAGQGVSLRMSAASGSKEAVGIIGVVNNASGNAGSMTFHTYNLGATIPEYMRLTNQGYLGIGETNPVAKLTVKGANDTNFEVQPDISSGINRITNFNRVTSTYRKLRIDASDHEFYISGNPKVTINTSGILTQEALPAFNAYHNGNVYSPNNNVIFEHDATRFDNGNNFNTTYHRFTAPVAGVYHFYFRTIIYGSGNNGHISFRKNGTGITGGNGHYSYGISAWQVFEMHTIQDMAANDYIDVYNNSRAVTYYHGNTWNEFSGYLVG